jgi:integrase
VNDQFVHDFWDWRLNYYGSDEHKRDTKFRRENKLRGLIIRKPTGHGLDNERKIMKEFLRWAFRMEYTTKGIPMALDKKPMKTTKAAQGFSFEEYKRIQDKLGQWIEDAPNENVKRTRRRVEFKFNLMLAYGTRSADLTQLQWQDVRFDEGPEKNTDGTERKRKHHFIAKAKNKRRPVPITEDTATSFRVWKEYSEFTDPDDFVFATQTGKSSTTDNDKWKDFLKELGLLYDENGKSRNMTTLRHTFATFAILYTNEKTSMIADRMGSSERQIQETYKDELRIREHERFTQEVVPMANSFDIERFIDLAVEVVE